MGVTCAERTILQRFEVMRAGLRGARVSSAERKSGGLSWTEQSGGGWSKVRRRLGFVRNEQLKKGVVIQSQ